MRVVRAWALCCIVLLSFSITYSQDTSKNALPLKDVLTIIERQFSVSFSYVDNDIEAVDVTLPPNLKKTTLEDILQKLQSQTKLRFNSLGNGFITITKASDLSDIENFTRNTLDDVIITQYLTKGIDVKASGNIVIDYDTFGILPGLIEKDVLLTAQSLPGVQSVDETVSNLSIRGGTHDQNLLLWDGIKMYQSGHFFGLISAFNPNLTKTATLFKNGTPARYTDGISGTILMESSNEVPKKLNAGLGSNLINAGGFADIPLTKAMSLQVSARQSINQVFETPTYQQYYNKAFQDTEITNANTNIEVTEDQFNFQDASLRWLWKLSKDDVLRVNALYMNNALQYTENAVISNNQESRQSGAEQNNVAAGLYYKKQWHPKLFSELQIYGSLYNIDATNFDIINNQRLVQRNEVQETGVRLSSSLTLQKHLNFEVGYHFIETGIKNVQDVDNPLFIREVKDVVRTHALFSELEYASPSKDTYIKIGGRLNYIESFGNISVEPRLSINQKLTKGLYANLKAEFKQQVTTQVIEFQNDFIGTENRRWILANNDSIPIQKSRQISSGLTYKRYGWTLNSEVFLKQVKGITTQSQGFQNQYRRSRAIGNYTTQGLETLLHKTFNDFGIWFTYTLNNNTYDFESLDTSFFPNNFEIEHAFTLATSYSYKSLKLSVGFNYHTGKPNTLPEPNNAIDDDSNSINFKAPNSSNLKDYVRLDASATYKFAIFKGLQGYTGISLWNVLSNNNVYNEYYKVSDSNEALQIRQFGLGFTPNITFKLML